MGRKRKKKKNTVYKRMNRKEDNKPFKLEEILQQKIVREYLVSYVVGYILNLIFIMSADELTSPIHWGVIMYMMAFKALIDVLNHPEWSKAYAMGHGGKSFVKAGIIWLFYIVLAFVFDLFGLDIRSFLGLAIKRSY